MHVGVIMSRPGVFSKPEGYYKYTRGIPRVHWGMLIRVIQAICFNHFWTNVSKLAGESMIKNLSQLRPVKFLGLVSVKQIT